MHLFSEMVRIVAHLGVASLCLLAAARLSGQSAPEPSPLLAYYDFEASSASGPDTFRLFERPGGGVDLSHAFHISGSRSLRLREGAGDGSFSEFLGFVPERREGLLFVQFHILFADPAETFNFALAGPRWFLRFERNGHAFWLSTREGRLEHRPAGVWKELLVPRPFVWYFVDLVYDVVAGTYRLAIYEEGEEEPIVDLYDQRNTADADRSSVAYYSFIGDLEDRGAARFFVDDLILATDPEVLLDPFVAPGRRRTFVEMYLGAWPERSAVQRENLVVEARRWLRGVEAAPGVDEGSLADRLEEAADYAFLASDLDLAEEVYLRLLDDPLRTGRILLKMADVYFVRGDLEAERRARERIYGTLELAERRRRPTPDP